MTADIAKVCASVPCRLEFRYGLASLLEGLCGRTESLWPYVHVVCSYPSVNLR